VFNLNVAARRMNDGGRVVCVSSAGARQLLGGASVYSASKAAVEALVRCWAVDLGPRGITINAVAPGTTATDAVKSGVPDAAKRGLIDKTSLGRLGTPEDIANVVALLCSDDAAWITGTFVDVNGGLHV
jgi:3-oxoacyl-[acyl-carrier protein] reductase